MDRNKQVVEELDLPCRKLVVDGPPGATVGVSSSSLDTSRSSLLAFNTGGRCTKADGTRWLHHRDHRPVRMDHRARDVVRALGRRRAPDRPPRADRRHGGGRPPGATRDLRDDVVRDARPRRRHLRASHRGSRATSSRSRSATRCRARCSGRARSRRRSRPPLRRVRAGGSPRTRSTGGPPPLVPAGHRRHPPRRQFDSRMATWTSSPIRSRSSSASGAETSRGNPPEVDRTMDGPKRAVASWYVRRPAPGSSPGPSLPRAVTS